MKNELNTIIQTRRSVFTKQFKPHSKVSDSIIEQMLENANYAPTHKLTEPWRFKIYTGEGLKLFTEEHVAAYEKLAGDRYSGVKLEKIKQPIQCSHLILIALKRHETVPYVEEVSAVAAAVQNMHLTAHAYGVGGYWSTGGVCLWEGAAQAFGFDDTHQLLGFFYVGEIAIPSPQRLPRPISEKVLWVK